MAKHVPWSDEDDFFLLTNWHQMLVCELEASLRRTKSSILRRARALGLPKKGEWSDEDNAFLQTNLPVHGVEYCAEQLKRSQEAVRMQAKRLEVPIPSQYHRDYTQDEDALLRVKSELPSMTYQKCADLLSRGAEGVRKRAKILGTPTQEDYRVAADWLFENSGFGVLSREDKALLEQRVKDPKQNRKIFKSSDHRKKYTLSEALIIGFTEKCGVLPVANALGEDSEDVERELNKLGPITKEQRRYAEDFVFNTGIIERMNWQSIVAAMGEIADLVLWPMSQGLRPMEELQWAYHGLLGLVHQDRLEMTEVDKCLVTFWAVDRRLRNQYPHILSRALGVSEPVIIRELLSRYRDMLLGAVPEIYEDRIPVDTYGQINTRMKSNFLLEESVSMHAMRFEVPIKAAARALMKQDAHNDPYVSYRWDLLPKAWTKPLLRKEIKAMEASTRGTLW
ncbi:hypothetical protein [Marinobacter sp.]|uniref:hypothetical protein n=1 Tax=Marinobacter sp. TaxID=50741 RepID=UPI003569F93A